MLDWLWSYYVVMTVYKRTTQPTSSHAVVGVVKGDTTECESPEWAAGSSCSSLSSTRVRLTARRRFRSTIIGLGSGCQFTSVRLLAATNARSRHDGDDLDSLSVAVTSSPEVTSRRSMTTEQRRRTVNQRLTTRRRVNTRDTWRDVDRSAWRGCRHPRRQLPAVVALSLYLAAVGRPIIHSPRRPSTCSSNLDSSDR